MKWCLIAGSEGEILSSKWGMFRSRIVETSIVQPSSHRDHSPEVLQVSKWGLLKTSIKTPEMLVKYSVSWASSKISYFTFWCQDQALAFLKSPSCDNPSCRSLLCALQLLVFSFVSLANSNIYHVLNVDYVKSILKTLSLWNFTWKECTFIFCQ